MARSVGSRLTELQSASLEDQLQRARREVARADRDLAVAAEAARCDPCPRSRRAQIAAEEVLAAAVHLEQVLLVRMDYHQLEFLAERRDRQVGGHDVPLDEPARRWRCRP